MNVDSQRREEDRREEDGITRKRERKSKREGESEKDRLEREGEASIAGEAHLIRVQGTNYFPILWPAKI